MIARLLRPAVTLVYHGVGRARGGDDPRRLVVAPELLEAHVRFLLARGYCFLTASEVDPRWRPPPRTALLTFDDGFADWVDVALPLLRRLGVRATFYACPGWWGGRHPLVPGEGGRLLDEAGARELHEAGMELGSHTLTHPDLRKLDDAALARELAGSKAGIEEVTGEPCATLAYPYGFHDPRIEAAAGRAGYRLAWAWLPGPWRPLAAPRLPAPPRHGAGRLSLKLLGIRRRGR